MADIAYSTRFSVGFSAESVTLGYKRGDGKKLTIMLSQEEARLLASSLAAAADLMLKQSDASDAIDKAKAGK